MRLVFDPFLFFSDWYGIVVCESGMRDFDSLSHGGFDCSLAKVHLKGSLQVMDGPFATFERP